MMCIIPQREAVCENRSLHKQGVVEGKPILSIPDKNTQDKDIHVKIFADTVSFPLFQFILNLGVARKGTSTS
jgi:hypothetical protein